MALTPLEKLAASSVRNFERKEPRPNAHFEVSDCTIIDQDNKKLDWPVLGGTGAMPLELTITGASTIKIELEDPHFALLNDPIFAHWMFKEEGTSKSAAKNYSRRQITDSARSQRYGEEEEREWILPLRHIDINVDGIYFRLRGFKVQETTLILMFEDRVAAMLREMVGHVVSHDRGQMTRAQFIVSLLHEAAAHFKTHLGVFCPEEKIVQEVAASFEQQEDKANKASAQKTVGTSEGITVGGQPASQNQINVANELLEVAEEEKAGFKATAALIYAAIGETRLGDEPGTYEPNSAGCSGVLQEKDAPNPHDTKGMAQRFLLGSTHFQGGGAINIEKTRSKTSVPQIAVEVEVPSIWPANAYAQESGGDKFLAEAEHIVKTAGLSGSSSEAGLAGQTVPAVYAFTRGPYENSWDCIQRLASEVSWYAFVRDNQLWYVSGDFLLAQPAGMTVERGEHGVDWIEPDIELGARDGVATVTVTGRASLWTMLPGQCVKLAGVGPANGKWVVDAVELDILDRSDEITVTLEKPLPARPEPNAGTEPAGNASGEGLQGASPRTAQGAFNASDALSKLALPYVWGGGHQSGGLENPVGLDCSGSTCYVLHESGMFNGTAAIVSGELEKWGAPGKGKEMTVWANANHVFIEFTIPGHGRAQMNTNGPQNGPRLYTLSQTMTYNPAPWNEGYVARHWPGT